RKDCWGSRHDNDIVLEPDELGRDLGESLVASFPPAILDRNAVTVDPVKFAHSLHKSDGPFAIGRTRALTHEPDDWRLPPLRPHRERPSGGRAAEKCDEFRVVEEPNHGHR